MALTLSAADSALKEDYQPAVREQINQAVMALQQFEKNSTDIEGRRAVLSVHTQRNSGVGARLDGGALPTAGNQGYREERVPLHFNYGRIQISGPTIRAMKSDRGSFVRAVDSETKGVTNDVRRGVNRQVFGTADGVIASTAANTTVTVVQLAATTTLVQMRQLEVGMIVDIGTVAAPTTDATARTITAVSLSALTITISGAAISTSAGDKVFVTGSGGAVGGVGQAEISGLQAIVLDSGLIFNIDPSVNPIWASVNNNNSGTLRAPTENLLAKVMHTVKISGGEDLNLWLTSDGVFRAYSNNLTAIKRFPNTLTLKGGFEALSITAGGGEVGLAWDRDAPSNTAFGLNTSHLIQFQMSDWEFMQEDGSVLFRVAGFDAYEATLFKYHELATDKRNAHAVVKDLLEA
jgi:hypothetical protein